MYFCVILLTQHPSNEHLWVVAIRQFAIDEVGSVTSRPYSYSFGPKMSPYKALFRRSHPIVVEVLRNTKRPDADTLVHTLHGNGRGTS
jgi:hypothetical protein